MAGSLAELMVSIIGDVSDVKKAFDEVDKSSGAMGKSLTSLGNDMASMGKSMSLYITAPLAAIGVGMSKMAMDFESEMLKVQAVTGGTGEDISALSDLALQLGADTVFSATDAAGAFYYLAAAGYDVNQITLAAADTMNLAAAGEMEMGNAANILTNILAGYGLGADSAAHVTDVLAQSAADTKAEVEPMGVAFSYVGPLAKEMGWSIEETAAILGEFSLRGYEGERAGAGLVTAMTNLLSPTNKVNEILAKYGLTIDDVNPSTHSFVQIIDTLNGVGLTTGDTMAIFGDRAGPQMLAAMSQGTAGIVTQTEKLKECDGAAQQMADTMTSGTKGGVEALKGSLETLAITMGTLINNYMDPILLKLSSLFDWFGQLPAPVLLAVVAIAGLAAAIGPLLIVGGTLVSAIGTISTALAGAGGLTAVLGTVVGILTGPVAIAIAAFAAAAYLVYKNWDTIGPLLESVWNQAKTVFTGILTFIDPVIVKISEFVNGALTSLSAWWNVNGPAIIQAAQRVEAVLRPVFEGIALVVGTVLVGALIVMYEAFRVALDIIIPLVQFLGKQFGETIMLIVNLINGDWSAALENFKSIFGNTIDFTVALLTSVLPTAFSDVWNDLLAIASTALDLLIQLITGKTGTAATELKTGIVNAGAELVDGMLGWVPGVSGVVDGMRDQLLRVPAEANTSMSQFGPVVTGQIDAAAVQAAAHTGTLVTSTVGQIATLPPSAATAMNPFSPAIVGPINTAATQASAASGTLVSNTLTNIRGLPTGTTSAMSGYSSLIVNPISAAATPAAAAATTVATRTTTALNNGMSPMISNTANVMTSVATSIRNSGSNLATAATSAGAAAVTALNTQLVRVQATAAQIKATVEQVNIFTGQAKAAASQAAAAASSAAASAASSSGSSSSISTGIKRQGSDGTGEENVKIREAHATGGIAGYTGWHWMEEKELAVPQKFDWNAAVVKPIVAALGGGKSNVSYGGDTVNIQNVTLTPEYDFNKMMSDIERYNAQKRFQRGVVL